MIANCAKTSNRTVAEMVFPKKTKPSKLPPRTRSQASPERARNKDHFAAASHLDIPGSRPELFADSAINLQACFLQSGPCCTPLAKCMATESFPNQNPLKNTAGAKSFCCTPTTLHQELASCKLVRSIGTGN